MPIRGGTRGTYEGSMAQAIEQALDAVRIADGLAALPAEGRRDRQLLFMAIAQGVVNHLVENEASFVIRHHGDAAARHDGDSDGHVVIVDAP